MRHRTRVKQTTTLDERLAKYADQLRAKAKALPHGERERTLKKARQFDVAIHINDCLTSPAMRQPTPPPSADRPRG
jgi:hypothetical protein